MRALSFAVLGAIGIAAAFGVSAAHSATLTVEATNVQLTQIKLNNSPQGGALTGTGNIQDPLYSSAPIVHFEVNQLADFASGAGTIKSVSTQFTQLILSLEGWTFNKLAMSTMDAASVTFTGYTSYLNGVLSGQVGPTIGNAGNGNQHWLVTSDVQLAALVIFSADGFSQNKQFEIFVGGLKEEQASPVPLPAGFVLLGSVLAGGGLISGARRRRRVAA